MAQKGFFVNQDLCIGCRGCEGACKQENDVPVGVRRRQVVIQEGLDNDSKPYRIYTSLACNHCAKPACVKICPVKAYTKDSATGLVTQDHSKCIGCQQCVWVCPYGAPKYDANEKKAHKCHGCKHRVTAGLKPACVTSCMALALEFDDLSKISTKTGAVNTVKDFADATLTNPSVRFKKPRNVNLS